MAMTSQIQPFSVGATSAAAVTRGGVLNLVNLIPGSATVTVTLYDNASAASGTILAVLNATTTGTGSNSLALGNLPFKNGIYVSYTAGSGTGATCMVYIE